MDSSKQLLSRCKKEAVIPSMMKRLVFTDLQICQSQSQTAGMQWETRKNLWRHTFKKLAGRVLV